MDEGREEFYECYSISSRFRDLKFSPRYILIFGRRSEYAGQKRLIKRRANKNQQGVEIVSFDRLLPDYNLRHYPTAKLDSSGFRLHYVPSTFELGPMIADELVKWNNFEEAVDKNRDIEEDRKMFLRQRAEYWKAFAMSYSEKGLICSDDWE